MARRRRRRRREVTFADLTEQSLESLNRIKTLISTADSITTSLRSVLGTYQAMQNDGSLNLLLSGSQTSRGSRRDR